MTADDEGPYVVRIEQVDAHDFPVVTLFVSVTDPASGDPVLGLAQDQFTVTEESKVVDILDFSAGNRGAISTVLTIDRSNSMGVEGKMAGAREAANAFVDMMRPQDRVALMVFSDQVTPWQDFTSDQAALHQRINELGPGGCTAWYDGVWQTVDLMAGVAGRRNAILLSDGIDCREDFLLRLQGNGSQHTFDEAITHAKTADVAIHTIGLGARATTQVGNEGFDEGKLQRMAAATGGTYHHAPTGQQLRALYESFAEVTQKEYVITFKSGRPSYDGTQRNIQVAVGESRGGGGYVEKHMLNVQSSPWVALILLAPLLLALALPLAWPRLRAAGREPGPSPVSASGPISRPGRPPGSAGAGDAPPAADSPLRPPPLALPPVTASAPVCPNCGRPVRAGARFCGSCGAALGAAGAGPAAGSPPQPPPAPAAAICPNCGNRLRPGAHFCSRCGHRSTP